MYTSGTQVVDGLSLFSLDCSRVREGNKSQGSEVRLTWSLPRAGELVERRDRHRSVLPLPVTVSGLEPRQLLPLPPAAPESTRWAFFVELPRPSLLQLGGNF